jgi:hypothetical protein
MPNPVIGLVMHRLMTDEGLRLCFEIDRVGTLAKLHTSGLELAPSEVELFIQADVDIWSWMDRWHVVRAH